jgi:hypothetical protein
LSDPTALDAHEVVTGLERDREPKAFDAARQYFDLVKRAASGWSDDPDDPLGLELDPWLRQAKRESAAALAAIGLLEHLASDAADADAALLHGFAVIFSWNSARAGDRVVFGPRFAVYPAVVQLPSGRAGLDVDLAVLEDRNAVDRLCRLALDAYRAWAATAV